MHRGSCPTAAKHAKARDRELVAFELRKTGASLREIADAIYRKENPDGMSGKRLSLQAVSSMIKRVMCNLEAASKEDAVLLRRMDLERLDKMLTGLWNKAKSGHEGAVDRVLRILERRSRLLGLDAPDLSSVMVRHEDAEVSSLSTSELLRLAQAIASSEVARDGACGVQRPCHAQEEPSALQEQSPDEEVPCDGTARGDITQDGT
jgi:hypothetical protein